MHLFTISIQDLYNNLHLDDILLLVPDDESTRPEIQRPSYHPGTLEPENSKNRTLN